MSRVIAKKSPRVPLASCQCGTRADVCKDRHWQDASGTPEGNGSALLPRVPFGEGFDFQRGETVDEVAG